MRPDGSRRGVDGDHEFHVLDRFRTPDHAPPQHHGAGTRRAVDHDRRRRRVLSRVAESAGRAGDDAVGAARLYQRKCEGCHIELNITEINEVRTAAKDEVLRCENCHRILVRTSESGL